MSDDDRFIADWWKRSTAETRALLEAEAAEADLNAELLDASGWEPNDESCPGHHRCLCERCTSGECCGVGLE